MSGVSSNIGSRRCREAARGGDHFIERQIIRDRRHLGAWPHHVLHRAPIQINDLQNDVAGGLGEVALLKSELDQLLIIGIRQRLLRFHRFRNHRPQQGVIEPLRELMQRARHPMQPRQRARHPQRPDFRPAHGKRFGQHLAEEEREQEHRGHRCHRPGQWPVIAERHPQSDRQHAGVGESIAQHHRRQQILRLGQQPRRDDARATRPLGKLAHLPFAEGKQRRLRQRKEETCTGANQDHHDGKNGCGFHPDRMGKNAVGQKLNLIWRLHGTQLEVEFQPLFHSTSMGDWNCNRNAMKNLAATNRPPSRRAWTALQKEFAPRG